MGRTYTNKEPEKGHRRQNTCPVKRAKVLAVVLCVPAWGALPVTYEMLHYSFLGRANTRKYDRWTLQR